MSYWFLCISLHFFFFLTSFASSSSSFVMAGAREEGIYIRSGSCWRSISLFKYEFTFIASPFCFHTQNLSCAQSLATTLSLFLSSSAAVFATLFWCSLIAILMSTVTSYDKLMLILLGLETHMQGACVLTLATEFVSFCFFLLFVFFCFLTSSSSSLFPSIIRCDKKPKK